MSNSFNFKRFGLLFKKHSVENFKAYLLLIAVFIGIVTILIGLMTEMGTQVITLNTQAITFMFLMQLAGTIFTSNIFANLGDKRKAIATLVLPASAFEKFLVGWIYSYLFFQLVFTVVFYTIVWAFLRLQGSAPLLNVFSDKQHFHPGLYIAYLIYAFLNAIAIYGAVYFKKMHFIKIAFIFFVIGLIIWLGNDAVLSSMIHHSVTNPPFTGLSFMSDHGFYNVKASDLGNKLVCVMFIVVSFIMWTATYFRLKEKQI